MYIGRGNRKYVANICVVGKISGQEIGLCVCMCVCVCVCVWGGGGMDRNSK